MYTLPTTVTVGDRTLHIRNDGDYRVILDCFEALNDEMLSEDLRVLASLLMFYNEFNSTEDVDKFTSDENEFIELVDKMYDFMNCGRPESPGKVVERPLIDWSGDEQMICSAVNNVARTEIRSVPYLHWWTFMGYYLAIGESVLSTVVSIRDKLIHGKKLEKWEQDFKRSSPEYFNWKHTSIEEREFEAEIRDLWNKEN